MADLELFYDPERRICRYMLADGKTIDVSSSHDTSSRERGWVLRQAQQKWGGELDDYTIVGVTGPLPEQQTLTDG